LTQYDQPGTDDRQRRRHFLIFSGSLGLITLLVFMLFDYQEGHASEILLDAFMVAVILLLFPAWLTTFHYEFKVGIRYILSLLFIIIIAYGLESSRYRSNSLLKQSNDQLKSQKERLEISLSEVKTLSGLLPICAHCKKIRDEKGYWKQIESFIHDHSEAEFSHGICPEWAKKLYPDLDVFAG